MKSLEPSKSTMRRSALWWPAQVTATVGWLNTSSPKRLAWASTRALAKENQESP